MFRRCAIRLTYINSLKHSKSYTTVQNFDHILLLSSSKKPICIQNSLLSTKQFSDNVVDAAEWHDVPIVSTTHSFGPKPFFGVYWGEGDPMNVYKMTTSPVKNVFYASLEAVMVALRQALYERKLDRVIVQTDSKYLVDCANKYLKIWRSNGYVKKDGGEVKNKEALEEYAAMLDMIEAKVRLSPTNVKVVEFLKKDKNFEHYFKDNDVFSALNSSVNERIFVASQYKAVSDKSNVTSYGVHFPNKTTLDACARFNKFPVTQTRAQLYGILTALKIAKENGMKNIEIVCDSPFFVKYYKLGWLKSDGSNCANYPYYKDIKKLADEIGVKFSFMPNEENESFSMAKLLADDALAHPVI